MRKAVSRLTLVLWVLFATLALAHWWLVRPDLFPKVPPGFSLWMIDLYGSTNGEELRDLESLLALGVAFPIVLFLTFSGIFVWRCLRK